MITMLFTWCIEFSQFYHAEWIDSLRNIKIFALVLGHGFLISDLIAYTIGISIAYYIDSEISSSRTADKETGTLG